MKFFLITSIIAMISAGIYGTVDLAKDINQGKLIQYERENMRTVKAFAATNKNLAALTNGLKTETKKEEKIIKPKVSDLKIEYFSRGEPPYFPGLEELAILDSAKNATDSTVVNPVAIVTETKVESEKVTAALPKIEERKFSSKLFSRGRPRPVVKEVVLVQMDTLKKQ